jgi:mRNA interferase MazF
LSLRVEHGVLYVADLNPRRGSEAGKVRPVLVIQTDLLNAVGHPSTWVLPCTTNLVGDNLLRVTLPKSVAGNSADCEVMIDQSRSIDNGRLKRRLGPVPARLIAEVKEKLRRLGDL